MSADRAIVSSVRDTVSESEWQLRVDLAAAYRLVAHYGWDDLIFTHISARVPDSAACTPGASVAPLFNNSRTIRIRAPGTAHPRSSM